MNNPSNNPKKEDQNSDTPQNKTTEGKPLEIRLEEPKEHVVIQWMSKPPFRQKKEE